MERICELSLCVCITLPSFVCLFLVQLQFLEDRSYFSSFFLVFLSPSTTKWWFKKNKVQHTQGSFEWRLNRKRQKSWIYILVSELPWYSFGIVFQIILRDFGSNGSDIIKYLQYSKFMNKSLTVCFSQFTIWSDLVSLEAVWIKNEPTVIFKKLIWDYWSFAAWFIQFEVFVWVIKLWILSAADKMWHLMNDRGFLRRQLFLKKPWWWLHWGSLSWILGVEDIRSENI